VKIPAGRPAAISGKSRAVAEEGQPGTGLLHERDETAGRSNNHPWGNITA
jgi:hypothetical protein